MWNGEMTSPTGDYLWLILLQQLAPAKMKISILAGLQSFRNPHPFTGRFPLLSSPSPLQMHLQMNKRWETGRLAGVLVTMAASKWNAKAPETDSESRNQVYGIELPVLTASFMRSSVPCLRLTAASWERRRRAAPQWHGHSGREELADLVSGDKRVVKKSYLYPMNLLNISAQF